MMAGSRLTLTRDELVELTAARRWSTQAAELDALGIPYRQRTDGSIVVLRDDLKARKTAQRRKARCEPDFSMLT